jgi:hypothetical protein
LNRDVCSKREFLQLLGHFNFAMRVIIPGRSFVSYLISLSTTVHGLKDKIFLSDECRIDLRFWHTFLLSWNGISMLYDTNYTRAIEMKLYTDASSTVGYGGYFKGKWCCSHWTEDLPTSTKNKFSMAFLELYPIVVAAVLWG